MDLQLHSIHQAPRDLPVWQLIMDDLSHPPVARIAKTLGVSERTVYRWARDESAPRMACMALFWLTTWGQSKVATQAANDAKVYFGLARCLGEEQARLQSLLSDAKREQSRLEAALSHATELLRIDHGNAAIAALSRMDTALGGFLGDAPAQALLTAPEPPPVPPLALLAEPKPLDEPTTGRAAGRGSPSTPQPEARSTRCPAGARKRRPRPSDRQEVLPLLP
jgi:hypothetical protein